MRLKREVMTKKEWAWLNRRVTSKFDEAYVTGTGLLVEACITTGLIAAATYGIVMLGHGK